MSTYLPDTVWLLDDDKDAIYEIKRHFGERKEDIMRTSIQINEVKSWFGKANAPPDLILLDICLEPGEDEIVIKKKKKFRDFSSLSQVSGIRFLTWLRCEWPKLPVVLMSAYWKQSPEMPNLSQHAVCLVPKPIPYSLSHILWVTQQAIIGIRLPENLREKAQIVIDEVNNIQNYFYFVLCNDEDDLVSPPNELNPENELEISLLFEAWNNRVLTLMEDEFINKKSSEDEAFHPILPFSRIILSRFSIRLSKEVDYMGEEYLASYLLRECARAAYLIFFKIKPHPVRTGICIFDNSTYPPDLLPGILRPEGICPECRAQMNPSHAFGGWSVGRENAAGKILQLARNKLQEIMVRTDEEE